MQKLARFPNSIHSQGFVESDKEQSLIRLFGSKLHLCRNKRSRNLEDFFCKFCFCHLQILNETEKVMIALTFSLVAAVCLLAAVHPSLAVVVHLGNWKIKTCKRKGRGNVSVPNHFSIKKKACILLPLGVFQENKEQEKVLP